MLGKQLRRFYEIRCVFAHPKRDVAVSDVYALMPDEILDGGAA
jgi:hypothetical protein